MSNIEPASEERTKAYARAVQEAGHPFTDRGLRTFLSATDDFVVSLAEESARTTSRRKGDAIDASDVDNAAGYLYSGTRRRVANHLGTVGGILLGIAGSSAISLYLSDTPDQRAIVFSILLTLVGAALVAWNTASDLNRR